MHPVTGPCPEAATANPVNFLLGKLMEFREYSRLWLVTQQAAGQGASSSSFKGFYFNRGKNPHLMPHPHCHIGSSLNK